MKKIFFSIMIIGVILCATSLSIASPAGTNNPPTAPSINGPTTGKAKTSYTFYFTSNDFDGDQIKYSVSWGDGTPGASSGLVDSGTSVSFSHSWSSPGSYIITAIATDEHGAVSDPSTLEITLTKSKAYSNINVLETSSNDVTTNTNTVWDSSSSSTVLQDDLSFGVNSSPVNQNTNT